MRASLPFLTRSACSYVVPALLVLLVFAIPIAVWRTNAANADASPRSFTTSPQNLPPVTPFAPKPAHNATDVIMSTVFIDWQSTDPEGDDITYDFYFGLENPPPLIESNFDWGSRYEREKLAPLSTYYWRVVARDSHGAETAGPLWQFTTRANSAPYFAHHLPADGWTNVSVGVEPEWDAYDDDRHPMVFDIYFGTVSPPPLVKSDQPGGSGGSYYIEGPLEITTQYWWKIVARDAYGLETSSPIWTFTTGGNQPPVVNWGSPAPADNGQAYADTKLWWISYDSDFAQATTDDIYLGTSEPLPLFASGITDVGSHEYTPPAPFEVGTKYYWRIVTSDGELSSTGQTWSFTVVSPGVAGDVNNDGGESMDDVACAMEIFVNTWSTADDETCGGLGSSTRADVNCSGKVTPRDARCIHRHILDESCTYCEGGVVTAPTQKLAPVVSADEAWIEYDTLHVRLAVSNVPSLESYGFRITSDPPLTLIDVVNLGPSGGVRGSSFKAGGYFLEAVDATSPVTFVELVLDNTWEYLDQVVITNFVDDLEGASDVVINGNSVPVLFSAFRAVPVSDGVQVSWELVSDEAMEKFTLYRREGAVSTATMIAEGPVGSTRGSYLDRSVHSGKTYHYELLITTIDGDEFRSPVASATTAMMSLALHQNFPNPFNPQTSIRYDIPGGQGAVRVRLWILDVAGHVVRTLVDENQNGGSREVIWRGTNQNGDAVSSGVYFYVLDAGGERRTRKLVLLK